jgi:hypothetical protein
MRLTLAGTACVAASADLKVLCAAGSTLFVQDQGLPILCEHWPVSLRAAVPLCSRRRSRGVAVGGACPCPRVRLPALRLRLGVGASCLAPAALQRRSLPPPWLHLVRRRWGSAMGSRSLRLAGCGRCRGLRSSTRPRRLLRLLPMALCRDGCRPCRPWTPRGSPLDRQRPHSVLLRTARTASPYSQTDPRFPLGCSRYRTSLGCPGLSCPRRKLGPPLCISPAGPRPATPTCRTPTSSPLLNPSPSRCLSPHAPRGTWASPAPRRSYLSMSTPPQRCWRLAVAAPSSATRPCRALG